MLDRLTQIYIEVAQGISEARGLRMFGIHIIKVLINQAIIFMLDPLAV